MREKKKVVNFKEEFLGRMIIYSGTLGKKSNGAIRGRTFWNN
tara:strand:+ start:409 stop:534 length:126 start_codon:yes stop_codon:yes gene_type:complete